MADCDYCGDRASHKCLKCNCLVCELGHCACPGRDDIDLGIADPDDAPEVPGDETTKRDPFGEDDDDDTDAQGDDDDGPDLGLVWGR